ncbi:MAG: PqqD family protein [Nitrospirae bacterium]|jgi:hypothetical protein|nr:PqqD family protein [Nitrospirota bacterium]
MDFTDAHLNKRYMKDPSVVFRKIAEEFIMVPIKEKAQDVESIYTMNEVAGRIWELIDGEKSLFEIKNVIIDEFEVGPEVAEKDLVEFINQLEQIGAVRNI